MKDGVYITNLDEYESIRSHWIALYVNDNNIIYFDSFEVEHIPKEIRKHIGNKNIKTNIYSIQPYDSKMSEYFWIGFIWFHVKRQKFIRVHKFIFS